MPHLRRGVAHEGLGHLILRGFLLGALTTALPIREVACGRSIQESTQRLKRTSSTMRCTLKNDSLCMTSLRLAKGQSADFATVALVTSPAAPAWPKAHAQTKSPRLLQGHLNLLLRARPMSLKHFEREKKVICSARSKTSGEVTHFKTSM